MVSELISSNTMYLLKGEERAHYDMIPHMATLKGQINDFVH